ncbi:MAG TPA: LysM peptidoglycan-binding domain-containing protein, partial [Fodinibius sp.]|nr:LysM peptidoglycan-binding domain-containing protein [Fodinibius sp.]
EVYRSVMTEYRQFYGITNPENKVKGEIFAIQDEMYAEEGDWMKERYKVPKNLPLDRTEVPLLQNNKVNRYLTYFSMKRPNVMEHWLKRSEKYFPMMKRIFEEENVPVELIHLSMIESGLNPRAQSWASAVGMWQFIRATGSMYGLDVNWWIDERRDPEKATRAAAQHLKDLYEVWGDWHLALAGYNISPRGLKHAIRRAGGKEDYWAASPYLPSETRNYVPSFIAATMIEMNPEAFGFKKRYGTQHYGYEVYQVGPLMSLDILAEAAGISVEKLKEYNPELLRWATPPGDTYSLKLPTGSKERFVTNYKDIPKDERGRSVAMHTVDGGESLGIIARKYGTSVRALYETNKDLSSTIYPGQKIVVPLTRASGRKIATRNSADKSPEKTQSTVQEKKNQTEQKEKPSKTKVRYKVRRGDTIGHIAGWFDVSSSQVRQWNNTSNSIRPGEYLSLYVPPSKEPYYKAVSGMSRSQKQRMEQKKRSGQDVAANYLAMNSGSGGKYTVQPNDTLIEIAKAHGISVSTIKQLNGINGSQIYVGQTLTVSGTGSK